MTSFADIDAVDFSILGTRDVDDHSQATITSEELFLGNKPVEGGLYTTELGADPTFGCKTCGKRYGTRECLGHFGEVQLRYPVLNPIHIKGDITKWLKVGCFYCGTPILDPADYREVPKSKRLKEYAASTQPSSGKVVFCRNPDCKKPQPKIEKNTDDYVSFSASYPDESVVRLHPHEIKIILSRITRETVMALGRTDDTGPQKLVLDRILIPPVTIRPGAKSIIAGGPEGASYHDIVTFLQYIVKKNAAMPMVIPQSISGEDYKKIFNLEQLYYDLIVGSWRGSPRASISAPPITCCARSTATTDRPRAHPDPPQAPAGPPQGELREEPVAGADRSADQPLQPPLPDGASRGSRPRRRWRRRARAADARHRLVQAGE